MFGQKICLGAVLFFSLFFNHTIFSEGFAAGTLVKVSFGYVPIEHIKKNDQVVSCGSDGCLYEKLVFAVFKRHAEAGIKITANGESFVAAPDQLFFMQPNNWIMASKLKVGDQLGEGLIIENIEIIEGPVEIYAFTIADFGNYFVSMYDILVHNGVAVALGAPVAAVALEKTGEAFVFGAGLATAYAASYLRNRNQSQQQTSNQNGRRDDNHKDPNNPQPTHDSAGNGGKKPSEKLLNAAGREDKTPRMTTKQAGTQANGAGYQKIKNPPFNSHGQAVFKKGGEYITPDVDSHNGGVWKMFDRHGTRKGTYNATLNVRIGK